MQLGILLHRENPTYTYWPLQSAMTHGFKMVLFTEPLEQLCRKYMCSTEAPSSYYYYYYY